MSAHSEGVPGYLRLRVINRVAGTELTNDLLHLHQSTWNVIAFQPGMPSSAAQGSFTIPLFPPGSEQFDAAWPTLYSKLTRWLRVEAYIGYDQNALGLGKLAFAGFITGITRIKGQNSRFELTGVTDVGLANFCKPFPGELTSNDVTSSLLKSYLGTNEMAFGDAFTTFVAGNYTSSFATGGSLGSWSGTTDDGTFVVSNATGNAATLISKSGGAANDRWHTHYVECSGRLVPSADTSAAGGAGIGLTSATTDTNNSVVGFFNVAKLGTRYVLSAQINVYTGGAITAQFTSPNALYNVDDPAANVPFTLGLLVTLGGNATGAANASLIVNGKVVIAQMATSYDPGTTIKYPFLLWNKPTTGSATTYYTNFVQHTRFTTDGPSSAAAFGNGSISTSTNSLGWGVDPGPSFLDLWVRCMNREGWYLRYTPQPYVVGSRTFGLVDFALDPGTDRSKGAAAANCVFSRSAGNLVELSLDDNADFFTSGTLATGLSTLDGGGLAYYRDVSTANQIGVLEDQLFAATLSDFNTLKSSAKQILTNKITTGNAGHKQALVLRDPDTVDKFSPLDIVSLDDPDQGVNLLRARIIARQFTEGSPTELVTFDQFSGHGREFFAPSINLGGPGR